MKSSIDIKKCFVLIDEIDIDKLRTVFNNVPYVDKHADSRITGLIMFEVEQMLDNIVLSKRVHNDRIIKLIIYLHCLGYTDKEISTGLNKIRLKQVSVVSVKKVRQRALDKIVEYYGKDVGLTTILYEAFGEFKEMSPKKP